MWLNILHFWLPAYLLYQGKNMYFLSINTRVAVLENFISMYIDNLWVFHIYIVPVSFLSIHFKDFKTLPEIPQQLSVF